GVEVTEVFLKTDDRAAPAATPLHVSGVPRLRARQRDETRIRPRRDRGIGWWFAKTQCARIEDQRCTREWSYSRLYRFPVRSEDPRSCDRHSHISRRIDRAWSNRRRPRRSQRRDPDLSVLYRDLPE